MSRPSRGARGWSLSSRFLVYFAVAYIILIGLVGFGILRVVEASLIQGLIAELEEVPRGLYCGALGYFGYHGESQFNIAIRTLVRDGERLSYHVGAGIVADSDPAKEYEETLHKAEGIRLAVDRWTSP